MYTACPSMKLPCVPGVYARDNEKYVYTFIMFEFFSLRIKMHPNGQLQQIHVQGFILTRFPTPRTCLLLEWISGDPWCPPKNQQSPNVYQERIN